MEFLFKHEGPLVKREDGIIVTGVMMRCTGDTDPLELPDAAWWTCWNDAEYLRRNCYYHR